MKRYDMNNITKFVKDAKKRLLLLFDGEDVFIEKEMNGEIAVRPKKEYNKNYDRSFLLRLPVNGRFVRTADHLLLDEKLDTRIFCSGIISYDLTCEFEAALLQTKDLIIEYNQAIKNWKILHKNKKIAEIREICDKFAV